MKRYWNLPLYLCLVALFAAAIVGFREPAPDHSGCEWNCGLGCTNPFKRLEVPAQDVDPFRRIGILENGNGLQCVNVSCVDLGTIRA